MRLSTTSPRSRPAAAVAGSHGKASLVVRTEKGDKQLSHVMASIARRNLRWMVLGGMGLAWLFLVLLRGSVLAGSHPDAPTPKLRSKLPVAKPPQRKKNVALRPVKDRVDPELWHSQSRQQLQDEFLECDWKKERPVHDADVWMGMREAYVSVVGPSQATVNLKDTFETAFQVPFEVRQSPGKGRGLFATAAVQKGTVLYDFSQSAQFATGRDFGEFLRILRPDLACDVLMWSYCQFFGNDGELLNRTGTADYERQYPMLRIVTDLDPGSFCNSGSAGSTANMAWLNADGKIATGETKYRRREDGELDEIKVSDYPPHAVHTRSDGSTTKKSAPLVALQDIAAGDELYCIYEQFSEGVNHMFA